jgi:hypothetical protein
MPLNLQADWRRDSGGGRKKKNKAIAKKETSVLTYTGYP